MKKKILFLCTGNSCRSQMAEGWTRHLLGDQVAAWSAGIAPHGLDPKAVQVMAEAGVDISGHRSKHIDELEGVDFDSVVTVCAHARESCPVAPGSARVIHAGFDDPPKMATACSTDEGKLDQYRLVRDQIRDFVKRNTGLLLS